MARPREFDTDAAINGAMNVFWKHGYEAASLPDLLEGMNISRGSLYKAFEDKKSLFLLVLAHYEEKSVMPAVELLSNQNTPDGWDRIKSLFSKVLSVIRQGDRRGCLLCSAAAGPASDDVDIAKAVHNSLNKMRKAFEKALEESSVHKKLDQAEKRNFADTLTTQYVGLRILARSHASLATLERSTNAIQQLATYAK